MKTISRYLCAGLLSALFLLNPPAADAQQESGSFDDYPDNMQEVHSSLIKIRSPGGKLYAYIVLLFNENPHFVNLIQEDSIPLKLMQTEDFHVRAYRNYLASIKTLPTWGLASTMLDVYLQPDKHTKKDTAAIEQALEAHNIIMRFAANKGPSGRGSLDYCIFGKRSLVTIKHPLFEVNERLYNIQPLIYYDEFSTSNSTFYFDMIYINPEEVLNDYTISRNVLYNKNVDSLFFVGARISDDIKYCLKKAFSRSHDIRSEIWKMFEIHEITHKVLNNHYNFYDQVIGEELALSSTIYANPYLGLAVMYSYLDYNAMNPHRIAALNFLRFIAQETANKKIMDDPSLLKNLSDQELNRLTKLHFNSLRRILK
jgi:hypothetical protein